MKRVFVLGLVLLAVALFAGCAGFEFRAEGCYFEPPYGRVCVTAVRMTDGKISVTVHADVHELPPAVRARAIEFGESLVKPSE